MDQLHGLAKIQRVDRRRRTIFGKHGPAAFRVSPVHGRRGDELSADARDPPGGPLRRAASGDRSCGLPQNCRSRDVRLVVQPRGASAFVVVTEARLLIVDDEPSLLELLKRYLERLGYQVETVATPEAALEEFQ